MIQHLVPASNCSDDFVGVDDPLEGFGVSVVVIEDDASISAARSRR